MPRYDTSLAEMWIHQQLIENGNTRDNISAARTVKRQRIKLPVEIEEYIIGFLENDDYLRGLPAIARCARVCRAWLPFSRYKLYYTVSLWSCEEWASFERAMSPSLRVAGYMPKVKVLIIRELLRSTSRCWTHLVLFKGTTVLTGLQEVTLHWVDFHRWNFSIFHSGRLYLAVTKLELIDCTFSDSQQLHLFVTAFPSLTHLELSDLGLLSWKLPSTLPNTIGHPLTHLRLEINTYSCNVIMACSFSSRSHPHISQTVFSDTTYSMEDFQ